MSQNSQNNEYEQYEDQYNNAQQENNSYQQSEQNQQQNSEQNSQQNNNVQQNDNQIQLNNTLIRFQRKDNSIDLKLFIGQLPKIWEKEQIKDFFSKYGKIYEVQVIRDIKGQHKGCAFVKFASMTDAERAIGDLRNKPLPGMRNNIEIKWADNEEERLGVNQDSDHKLFIGSLPKTCTEQNIRDIFETFGEIDELHLMKDNQNNTRQAFLRYKLKEKAHLAIKNLNSQVYIGDQENPIEVRFAKKYVEPDHPKVNKTIINKNVQQAQHKVDIPFVHWQKTYFKYYTEDNQGYYYHPFSNTSTYEKPSAGSLIHDVDGTSEYIEPNSKMQMYQKNEVCIINDRKEIYDGKKHGPPGANLFIFHLPTDFRDSDLERLFSQYGEVISARVNTRPDGTSKGFGFISFNTAKEAEDAIHNLNGIQIKNKRLKVEIKKEQNSLHSSSFQSNFNPF